MDDADLRVCALAASTSPSLPMIPHDAPATLASLGVRRDIDEFSSWANVRSPRRDNSIDENTKSRPEFVWSAGACGGASRAGCVTCRDEAAADGRDSIIATPIVGRHSLRVSGEF